MPEPAHADLLISGGMIVTVDPAWTVHPDGAVAVVDGAITAVGPRAEVTGAYEAARTIDGRGKLIIPGLINTHTHAPMVIYRGLADDLPLMTWLEEVVWPAEARFTTAESVEAGAVLAAAEMIAGGTTCFCDMYFFADEAARAAQAAGLRAVIARTFLNFPSPDAPGPEAALADAEAFLGRWQGNRLITPAAAPHSIYTVDDRWLFAGHALAVRFDVPYHIHVSETAGEVDTCRSTHKGLTPPAYLDRLGVLDHRTVAAHCVHVTAEDIALLAARGAGVAHCPESNMKLASGVAPVPDMLAQGVKVGLGSDGAMSNNNLSMLGTMNITALLHKVVRDDPTVVPARTVVYLATQGGANVLGLGDRIGSLEPGKRADLVLLRLDRPHAVPLYDPYSHLAYVLNDSDVDTVVIDGQVVYDAGRLTTIALDDARAVVLDLARQIGAARTRRVG
jgi:5-methylthioadenosine/S-adenosylhomocysteine deaminase